MRCIWLSGCWAKGPGSERVPRSKAAMNAWSSPGDFRYTARCARMSMRIGHASGSAIRAAPAWSCASAAAKSPPSSSSHMSVMAVTTMSASRQWISGPLSSGPATYPSSRPRARWSWRRSRRAKARRSPRGSRRRGSSSMSCAASCPISAAGMVFPLRKTVPASSSSSETCWLPASAAAAESTRSASRVRTRVKRSIRRSRSRAYSANSIE